MAKTKKTAPSARARTRGKPAPPERRRSLETYRRKRDFKKTSEPAPVVASSVNGNSYLIQKHAARRLHYDFRLELDGVLLSWAVPNGPSLDPADKRLAVQTEDHPFDYGNFEGVIPAGEYGGGTVMLWDRGTWEPIGDPREGLQAGNLKFLLHGERLHGKWVLVRMKKRPNEKGDKDNWLLIKERDDEAKPGQGAILTAQDLSSVVSERSMEDIAAQRKRVWSSKTGEVTDAAPPQKQKAASRRATKVAGEISAALAKAIEAAPRAALPDFVPPALCTLVSSAPPGERWVHEIKFDGYRMQARLENGEARLLTRNGLDWTNRFPTLAKAMAALPAAAALIDGEIVALAKSGVSSFSALQDALSDESDSGLVYYAFDLPHLDGRNLAGLPLEQRKAALQALLAGTAAEGPIRYSEHVADHGEAFFEQACRLSLEGIVSKRRDAPYRSGRGRDWVKVKCTKRQEFVIGGWLSSNAAGRNLRSILVGFHDKGQFTYAGKIGTGFNDKSGAELARRLRKLARDTQPFAGVLPSEVRRGAQWVEPKLVIEAEFAAWTADRILRHAAFKGIREDKPAREIASERPADAPSAADKTAPQPRPAASPPQRQSRRQAAAEMPASPRAYGGIKLTHPDRKLWPEDGVTKQTLADYYAAVAPLMLPHIVGRPLSLLRCPDGVGGQCFFQRHSGQGLPAAVKPVKVRNEKQAYLAIDDIAGLFALVQFSTLEIHPWGSRADDPDHPDRIVMDFDPHETVPWTSVIAAALECRERLTAMGLVSFVKTTGGKGLHVVVPLEPKHDWDMVRGFSEALARTMAKDNPIYVTTMTKSARSGRIYIDYLRNARTATAIAPYSTRARAGAPVAMPLSWPDVKRVPAGNHFTLASIPRQIDTVTSDPWAEMVEVRQSLSAKARKAVGMK